MRKKPRIVVPSTSQWFLEPIGEYSNKAISGKLAGCEEVSCCRGMKCVGGSHDLWAVNHQQVLFFEQSRKTDEQLHFAVWRKARQGSRVRLHRSDASYSHHRPDRKLLDSLMNGFGEPVSFPIPPSKRIGTLR